MATWQLRHAGLLFLLSFLCFAGLLGPAAAPPAQADAPLVGARSDDSRCDPGPGGHGSHPGCRPRPRLRRAPCRSPGPRRRPRPLGGDRRGRELPPSQHSRGRPHAFLPQAGLRAPRRHGSRRPLGADGGPADRAASGCHRSRGDDRHRLRPPGRERGPRPRDPAGRRDPPGLRVLRADLEGGGIGPHRGPEARRGRLGRRG